MRNQPIRRQLMTVILLTSGAVLLLTCAAFVLCEWIRSRQDLIQSLTTLAQITAGNSTAALAFENENDARFVLSALRTEQSVVAACLYDKRGKLFVSYPTNQPAGAFPSAPGPDGHEFAQGHLVLFQSVQESTERLGTIYLKSSVSAMYDRFRLYGGIGVLVMGLSLLVAIAISSLLQKRISDPILALADIARTISQLKDYSVRAPRTGGDEFGMLTDAFNHMLTGIEEREAALRSANETLQGEITWRKEAEENLRLLNETLEQRVAERTAAAEAANRAKSIFLANMSHEIRTPMTAILGYSQILRRDQDLPAKYRPFVETIEKSGDHLLAMINDILDLSKIEAGRMELHESNFDLAALTDTLAAMFRVHCKEKNLRLQMVGLSAGPVSVRGDEGKLRQVLINLLANAVKFTDHGGVTLCVKKSVGTSPTLGASAGKACVPVREWYLFEVIDTGKGLSAQAQADLFQPFHQGGEGRKKGGTGLGLAIAQRQVELMGGQLGVGSRPGEGARFFFEIPLAPAATAGPARLAPGGEMLLRLVKGYTVRALVVDDVAASRDVIAHMLRSLQCQATTAEDGFKALEQIRAEPPDIIFMDIRMPEMDGSELLRRIFEEFGRSRLKIVAVSASALSHEQQTYREAGFDAFLSKPLRFDEVCDCLQKLLNVQFENVETPHSQSAPRSAPDLTPLTLPPELCRQLKAAAQRHSGTRLEQSFVELEKLGGQAQRLADWLRHLVESGNVEAVSEALEKLVATQ